ncbi:MAG: hypothetical protein HQK51_03140 [Oligoflexia bacterium]|nr:hypothetical protein [Oligoflexia bacterium]
MKKIKVIPKFFNQLLISKLCFCFVLFSFNVLAIEFKGDVYNETGTQKARDDSPLNPANRLNLNEEEFYTRAGISAKGNYKDAKGYVKFEGIYAPVDFNRASIETSSKKDKTYLKAAYIDFQGDDWSVVFGKKFVSWGSGIFFYPLDVINYNRDPLRPLEEAEGNSFLRLSSFYFEYFTPELYVVTIPERPPYQVLKASDVQLVPRISFNVNSFGGFFFAKWRGNQKPSWGANFNYVKTIFQSVDISTYAEGLLRSEREKFTIDRAENADHTIFPAFLVGLRSKINFSTVRWVDALQINVEYYYDRKNWSSKEFNQFLSNYELYYNDYVLFSNSQSYRYIGIFLESFMKKNLRVGFSLVTNNDDQSSLLIPEISYSFSNQNARMGIRSMFFSGDRGSEFGSYPVSNQLLGYGELSF